MIYSIYSSIDAFASTIQKNINFVTLAIFMDDQESKFSNLGKVGLDVMQTHPLHRMHFSQYKYQASSVVLG